MCFALGLDFLLIHDFMLGKIRALACFHPGKHETWLMSRRRKTDDLELSAMVD